MECGARGAEGAGNETPRGPESWWRISLSYRHFRQPRVEELVRDVCQLLGYQGSLPSLLDLLLEWYQGGRGSGRSSELLVVIGYVLLGAGGRGCVTGQEKVGHFFDFLFVNLWLCVLCTASSCSGRGRAV